MHHAKCMGLFRYEDFQTHQEEASIDDQWSEWIGKEKLRRLGWAVYVSSYHTVLSRSMPDMRGRNTTHPLHIFITADLILARETSI